MDREPGATVSQARTGPGRREPEGELAAAGVDVETAVTASADVVDAIVEESHEHDLTIVGTTREGILEQLVFGAIPEAVRRRAEGVLIRATGDIRITSRPRRWLGSGEE